MNADLRFTDEQRVELAKLGVLDLQVDHLLEILPLCRALVTSAPAKSDVRDVVDGLVEACHDLQQRLSSISSGGAKSPAIVEALARLLLASSVQRQPQSRDVKEHLRVAALGPYGEEIATAKKAVAAVSRLGDEVLARLGAEPQRYHRSANAAPVCLIHQALLLGWGAAFYPVNDAATESEEKSKRAAPFPFRPSSNVTSRFRQVVTVCYQAFLESDAVDPERAIRAFIADRKRH